MKYEYLLKCWGGFFNSHNVEYHGVEEFTYKWFDTEDERGKEISRLLGLVEHTKQYLLTNGKVNDSCLVIHKSEGILTRYKQVIQAHVLDEGTIKIVENNLGYGFYTDVELQDVAIADYMKMWKYDLTSDLSENHKLLFSTLILRK